MRISPFVTCPSVKNGIFCSDMISTNSSSLSDSTSTQILPIASPNKKESNRVSAAVVISKILYPETEKPVTLGRNVTPYYERENSLFEAIMNGAQAGVKVIVGIVALLIAILGLVSLCDLFLGFIGSKINLIFGFNFNWSLSNILGYLFYPFCLILGIPLSDCLLAAKIIGERLILTEVVSYQHLATAMAQGLFTNPRSAVIITYALCGFSHIASMAIFVGGISALIPERRNDIVRVSWRALLGATLACLLTACVAGTFLSRGAILFGNLKLKV